MRSPAHKARRQARPSPPEYAGAEGPLGRAARCPAQDMTITPPLVGGVRGGVNLVAVAGDQG